VALAELNVARVQAMFTGLIRLNTAALHLCKAGAL
jgi:hypothetical protein